MHRGFVSGPSSGNALLPVILILAGIATGLSVLAFPSWRILPLVLLVGSAIAFLKWPFAGFLFLTATIPLLNRVHFTEFGNSIPDLDYNRAIILGMFSVVLLRTIYHRKTPTFHLYDKIIALYFLYGLSMLFRSPDLRKDLAEFCTDELLPVLIYVVARTTLVTKVHFQRWLLVLAGVGTVASTILLTEFVLQRHLISEFLSRGSTFRSHGTLVDPNSAGTFVAICLGPLLFLLFRTQNSIHRLVYLGMLAVTTGGVFVTFSRRGWLVALLVAITLCLTRGRKRFLFAAGVPAALLILATLPNLIGSNLVQGRVLAEDSVESRLRFLQLSFDMFTDSPLYGLGYNSPRHLLLDYHPDAEWVAFARENSLYNNDWSPHNSFLTALIEGGVIRFFLLCTVLFFLIPRVVRTARWREATDKDDTFVTDFLLLTLALVVSLTVASLAGDVLRSLLTLSVFLSLAAAIVNGIQREGLEPVILATEGPDDDPNREVRPPKSNGRSGHPKKRPEGGTSPDEDGHPGWGTGPLLPSNS